jgi:glycosyltransferase involved in cell wall biosynthesis
MGKNQRILFVVTQADWGGAQTFIFKAAREAMRRGFDVLLAYGGEGLLAEKCKEAGVPHRKLIKMKRNISPVADIGAIAELVTLMREWKPDVAFLNSSKAGIVGAVAGRLAGVKKIIYRIGGWSFMDPVSPAQKTFRLWSEKITAGLKDTIIVNTPQQVDLATQHGIRPRKDVVLIPNGIDITSFDAELLSREAARAELAPDAGSAPILYTIANFYPAKNLSGYLDALAIVAKSRSDIRAIIVGEGAERADLEAKRHALGLDNIISLPGQRADAARLLRGGDIFILPSVKEGFSWSVLEAMTAAVPVVTTDVGGNKWMSDGTTSIVPPNDPAALAGAILNTLADLETARINAAKSRRVIEERFTEKEVWEKLFGIL